MGRDHWIQTFFTVAIGAITIMTPIVLITVWSLNSIHDLDTRTTTSISRVELRQMELDANMNTRVTKIETTESALIQSLHSLNDSIRALNSRLDERPPPRGGGHPF